MRKLLLITFILIVGCDNSTESNDIYSLVGSWTAYEKVNNNLITASSDSTFGSIYLFNSDSTFTLSFWEWEEGSIFYTSGGTIETYGTWYSEEDKFTIIDEQVTAGENTFIFNYQIIDDVLHLSHNDSFYVDYYGDFVYRYNRTNPL